MAATSGKAVPIVARQVIEAGTAVANLKAIAEKATQTFLQGTPVQVDVAGATGFIIACPTITNVATAHIAGFSVQPGSNLSTSGVGKTLTTGQIPPNQASAVVIPVGAPWAGADGLSYFTLATDSIIFMGWMGGSITADPNLTQAMIGGIFGLTKDAGNNFWYVDNDITATANGACVEVVDLIGSLAGGTGNPYSPIGAPGLVAFRVLKAAQQLSD